ncbi:hypothetical protein [Brevifollis gellanilyticus]|uniref:Uncharacterized protein n=1 Tax=Brevifollis gellanilyticus TaxID=748831 RepID=A0A512M2Z1_9BACT|nr:hypothetical protein [Brevifollis gellanilyticus]GEP41117.1 hypothetical protein BGE01nite_04080 [Brevifollis gellanilyticus]
MRQVPENEFSGPALTEGGGLLHTPATLSIGQPIEWESYMEDGLGPAKMAVFEMAKGSYFSIQYVELGPKDALIFYVMRGDVAQHADDVLMALGLTSRDLGWLADGVQLKPVHLIRQDDNGVQFHAGDFPCRADAEAAIVRLAAGAHKQAYFVEPITGKGPSLRFSDDFRSPPSIVPE